jgi:hypothetical protein
VLEHLAMAQRLDAELTGAGVPETAEDGVQAAKRRLLPQGRSIHRASPRSRGRQFREKREQQGGAKLNRYGGSSTLRSANTERGTAGRALHYRATLADEAALLSAAGFA